MRDIPKIAMLVEKDEKHTRIYAINKDLNGILIFSVFPPEEVFLGTWDGEKAHLASRNVTVKLFKIEDDCSFFRA